MTAPDILPLHALAEENLAAASRDLLRAMVKTFADLLCLENAAGTRSGRSRVRFRGGSPHDRVRCRCVSGDDSARPSLVHLLVA
ncbi:hypothetical protein ABZ479_15975 [Streptomyces sp. NPDC005722]